MRGEDLKWMAHFISISCSQEKILFSKVGRYYMFVCDKAFMISIFYIEYDLGEAL